MLTEIVERPREWQVCASAAAAISHSEGAEIHREQKSLSAAFAWLLQLMSGREFELIRDALNPLSSGAIAPSASERTEFHICATPPAFFAPHAAKSAYRAAVCIFDTPMHIICTQWGHIKLSPARPPASQPTFIISKPFSSSATAIITI